MAKQIQWSLSIHLWTICNHIWRITYWNDLTKDDLSNIKYNSGWKSTIVGFGVASCRTAQSMLHASNITKTRRALQVTVFALYKLKRISYEIDMILEGKDTDFDIWCQEKCDEYCKRCFFFALYKLNFPSLTRKKILPKLAKTIYDLIFSWLRMGNLANKNSIFILLNQG